MSTAFIPCTLRFLPDHQLLAGAERAIRINPANRPALERMVRAFSGRGPTAEHLALLTSKYWGPEGVHLTVGFLDHASAELQTRIVAHMNAWGQWANVVFALSNLSPQVRIVRGEDGYWSYLGTDILSVPAGEPTMNLEGFTMQTSEAEFRRVVRHETGHTLGFPHEHMRQEIIDRIHAQKAIRYFADTEGWSAQEVVQQVLTPLAEASLVGTVHADPLSIMCYQLPGSITTDGQPIAGGADIDLLDQDLAAKVYPPLSERPRPEPAAAYRLTVESSAPITVRP